jgi:hypothetical protein
MSDEAEVRRILADMEEERLNRDPMPCKECGARTLQRHAINCDLWASSRVPKTTLTDGSPVTPEHREIDPRTGMQKGYVVLSEEERAKGFVRPVRRAYRHEKCGTVTTMGVALAETYARDPKFYGATFCCGCGAHYPVGEGGEFVWKDTTEKVGT